MTNYKCTITIAAKYSSIPFIQKKTIVEAASKLSNKPSAISQIESYVHNHQLYDLLFDIEAHNQFAASEIGLRIGEELKSGLSEGMGVFCMKVK